MRYNTCALQPLWLIESNNHSRISPPPGPQPLLSSRYWLLNLRLAQSGTVGSLRYCSLLRDRVTTTSVAPNTAPPRTGRGQ